MDSQKADVESPAARRSQRGRAWWIFALVIGGAWWAWERPTQQSTGPTLARTQGVADGNSLRPSVDPSERTEPAERPPVAANPVDVAAESPRDALTPEQCVLGVWRDFYRGERTLTLNADGSGTMVVKLAGMAKKLFAETLQFDLTWQFEEGRLVMSTVDGRPASKFELIRKLYGDRADYEVLELTADQMRLRDAGGKTEYDWRRPEKLYEDVALDDQSSL